MNAPRPYSVNPNNKKPLLDFIISSLECCGCKVLFCSDSSEAPFKIVFERPSGERLGIIAYAFNANRRVTTNRPTDERRFQVKYGGKDGELHTIWQDPSRLYTTIFLGIDTTEQYFVGADPILHSPTKFFISIEFKDEQVEAILKNGWYSWERDRRQGSEGPIEVLVGGKPNSFLRYILFEREAWGEDQGHRQFLAEKELESLKSKDSSNSMLFHQNGSRIHKLTSELQLSEAEVMDVISEAPRLKMAVRGWVAEEHLLRTIKGLKGVSDCSKITLEGGADIGLNYKGTYLTLECKNVLRNKTSLGLPRLDFQRTRASKADPCSRFYRASDFNIVAACLHSVSEKWEFRFALPTDFPFKKGCPNRLANNIVIDDKWVHNPDFILQRAIEGNLK